MVTRSKAAPAAKVASKANGKKSASPARFPTKIDLPLDVREAMIPVLNQSLADAFDLMSQTKQAHWNVKGMQFIALHELFDSLADDIEEYVDMLAERVTALGGYAMGTARMAAAASTLPEFPSDVTESKAVVSALVERYATFGANVRRDMEVADDADDETTTDLYTEISRGMDKHLWFLEAHLQA
jgi:starvation-inducible DNA-binding protein